MSSLKNLTTSEFFDPADFFSGRSGKESERSARTIRDLELGELRRQFDIGQERLQPTLAEAVPAFQLQSALAGSQGPQAQQLALQGLGEAPGTEFAREQGLRLIESGAAATGGLGGGNRLRDLTRFGTELASRGLQNQFSRLGIVSGAGQGAGSELVGLGSRFAQNVGAVTQQGAQNITQALQQQQQQRAQAAGTGIGIGAAVLSDENMKTDIKNISNEECFNLVMKTPLKAWRYLKECDIDTDLHLGPMSQEAPDCIKTEGKEALNLHDELWLIAGALKHHYEVTHG